MSPRPRGQRTRRGTTRRQQPTSHGSRTRRRRRQRRWSASTGGAGKLRGRVVAEIEGAVTRIEKGLAATRDHVARVSRLTHGALYDIETRVAGPSSACGRFSCGGRPRLRHAARELHTLVLPMDRLSRRRSPYPCRALCRAPARHAAGPEPMVATVVELRSSAMAVTYYERDGYYAKNDPEHRQARLLVRGRGQGAGAQGPRAPVALHLGAVGIRAGDGHASRPDARGGARAPARLGYYLVGAEVGVAGGSGDGRPPRDPGP